MRFILSSLVLIAVALFAAPAALGQSLLENGDFENPGDPFKGWVTDYEWTKNSFYVGNKAHLTIASEGARKNIVNFGNAGDGGVQMECRAFPLEPGFKYICNLDIKSGAYRVYFAGYQWAPGIRPHENPELGQLRKVYQSKALVGSHAEWKKEKLELPGVALSDAAKTHLKKVRYLTLFIWMLNPGSVDNVTITKVADPAMKF